MKEFIDKLIERLEECEKAPKVENQYNNGWVTACQVIKNKVNELAEEYKDKAMSNADKIRSMTNKEMSTDLIPLIMEVCEDGVPCDELFLEWLQSEAEQEQLW